MEKDKRVWISSPSWPNHAAILNHLGIQFNNYNYFDYDTCEVNFSRMMSDLQKISSGDVLLLHGCCHNPTGANLSLENWTELTQFCEKKNILPLIDLAYQGFGDGINDDVKGVQYMASNLPEVCIGISCSKNFGLYRERVGAALMVVSDKKINKLVEEYLKSLHLSMENVENKENVKVEMMWNMSQYFEQSNYLNFNPTLRLSSIL